MEKKIISLRMERQLLDAPAGKEEYDALYRDTQPGHNVYWNGFGQPPTLSFRANFDDLAYNALRQNERALIKGRFADGNLGWIVPEDLELFLCAYEKPLKQPSLAQMKILDAIERMGPLNIQQMKEETGLLVKEITPALHRLQQAFLLYEDQYDSEWDRSWYRFEEMFPSLERNRYTRPAALKELLLRFARRNVAFSLQMAKDFYKLPGKEIQTAIDDMCEEKVLVRLAEGYILTEDMHILETYIPKQYHSVYALHRNDFLYKSNESKLKSWIQPMTEHLPYDHDPLQYLLIDGEFHGASVGHFRNGPYDLNDIVCDLPNAQDRKWEIVEAVRSVNYGKTPARFMGEPL